MRVIDGGQATQVDYAAMAAERPMLSAYLQRLATDTQAQFNLRPVTEQLAFLINTYNAGTLELILNGWPYLDSIKDLGNLFRSPWSKAFIPLSGKTRSLDAIEHDLIGGSGRYLEPRIYFAVNCASIGCPALRAEVYQGARLEAQLEAQPRQFLGHYTEALGLSQIQQPQLGEVELVFLDYDWRLNTTTGQSPKWDPHVRWSKYF